MNRRWTRGLSLAALGLIVAVPSADVLLRQPGNAGAAVVLEGGAQVPATEAPATRVAETRDPWSLESAPDAGLKTFGPPAPEPPTVAQSPQQVPTRDPATSETAVAAKPDSTVENAQKPLGSPIPLEFRVASIGKHDAAPIPMPAEMRPPTPSWLVGRAQPVETNHRATSRSMARDVEFIDEVRQSIATIRSVQRERRHDDWYESDYPIGYAPNRGYEESYPLQPFAPGEFEGYYAEEPPGYDEAWEDAEYYDNYDGGFEARLPARRGNGIRLDLVQ